jgi:hypothetical protein
MDADIESVDRIAPARVEEADENVMELVAQWSANASCLGASLHRRSAASLAELVRTTNCY